MYCIHRVYTLYYMQDSCITWKIQAQVSNSVTLVLFSILYKHVYLEFHRINFFSSEISCGCGNMLSQLLTNLRQEDCEFQSCLGSAVNLHLNKNESRAETCSISVNVR